MRTVVEAVCFVKNHNYFSFFANIPSSLCMIMHGCLTTHSICFRPKSLTSEVLSTPAPLTSSVYPRTLRCALSSGQSTWFCSSFCLRYSPTDVLPVLGSSHQLSPLNSKTRSHNEIILYWILSMGPSPSLLSAYILHDWLLYRTNLRSCFSTTYHCHIFSFL